MMKMFLIGTYLGEKLKIFNSPTFPLKRVKIKPDRHRNLKIRAYLRIRSLSPFPGLVPPVVSGGTIGDGRLWHLLLPSGSRVVVHHGMHAVLGAILILTRRDPAGSTFATIVFVIAAAAAAAAAVIQEHFHSVFDVVVNHHRVRGVDSRSAAHILVSLRKDGNRGRQFLELVSIYITAHNYGLSGGVHMDYFIGCSF